MGQDSKWISPALLHWLEVGIKANWRKCAGTFPTQTKCD